MRIGLSVSSFTWPGGPERIGPTLGRIAIDAEQAGLHSLWVMDHFFQIPIFGPVDHDMLEAYSTLAYLAGRTERIELGALVTGSPPGIPGCWSRP